MIPQLLIIAIGFIQLGSNMSNHGKDSKRKINAWHRVIVIIMLWTTLYFGGFWDVLIKN